MKFRPVRRFLDEAMNEVKEFNSMAELKNLLPDCVNREGRIKFTYQGLDERIGWQSFLISIDGQACGHCNGVPAN